MNRILLIWAFIISFINYSFCGNSEVVKYMPKSQIHSGSSLTVKDNLYYSEEIINPGNYQAKRNTVLRLKYTRDNQTDEDANYWTYTINYTLTPGGNTGTLEIRKGKTDKLYEAVAAINNNQAISTVHINSITATYSIDGDTYNPVSDPAASGNIPEDIQIEIAIQTERYQFFDYNAQSANPPVINFDASNNTVYWTYVDGAEEYELEWVYIDDMIGSDLNDLSAPWEPPVFEYLYEPFEYKEPVRIITKQHEFRMDMTYSLGTLYFRVRGVGRHITGTNGDFSYPNPGYWGNTQYHISTDFESDKNTVSTSSFAEDGKHKTVVSYFDGLLKSRQTQTVLSTEDVNVVKTERYDYEGRASVNILPVPVDERGFNYKADYNLNSAGNGLFDKTQFDEGTINPMGSANGAGQYYSDNNEFINDPFRNYIPDGNGYSYVQTRYTNDNTGRISSVSGLGQDLKTGSGHDTRFLYSEPNKVELQRLFGSNVGDVSHYRKNYTIDPNNQVSAVYLDQEGRTVATCLVGNTTHGLLSDADENVSTGTQLTVDASSGNEIIEDDGLVSRNIIKITNEQPGKVYTFHYNLNQGKINRTHTNYYLGFEEDEQIDDPSVNNLIVTNDFSSGSHSLYLNQEKLVLKKYVVKANDVINASAFVKYLGAGESAMLYLSLENPDETSIPGYFFKRNATVPGNWYSFEFSLTVPDPAGIPGYNHDYFILEVGLAKPTDWQNVFEPTWFDDINIDIQKDGAICPSCIYDLTVKVNKPDGTSLFDNTRTISNPVSYNDCSHDLYVAVNGDVVTPPLTFDEVGTYIVTKELTVKQQSLDILSDDLNPPPLGNGTNYPGFPNQTAMTDQGTLNLDYSECSCRENCINWLIETNGVYPSDPEIEQCEHDNCQASASNLSVVVDGECDGMLSRMMADVSPGGILYDKKADGTPSDWWAPLTVSSFSWMTTPFKRKDGTEFTVTTTADIQYLMNPANWVDSWADNLVLLHPEHCQYDKCMFAKPYRKYILEMTTLALDPDHMWNGAETYTSYLNNPSGQVVNYTEPANQSLTGHDPIIDIDYSEDVYLEGLVNTFKNKVNVNYYTDPGNPALIYSLKEYCQQQDDPNINPEFYSTMGETFSQNPTQEQKQWYLFVGLYMGLRDQLLKDILNNEFTSSACDYYSTSMPPALYHPPIVENYQNYDEFSDVQNFVSNCTSIACPQCEKNADTWIATIKQNCCTTLTNEAGLRSALIQKCKENLNYENPFGMLTVPMLSTLSPSINSYCSGCTPPCDLLNLVASDYSITTTNINYTYSNNVAVDPFIAASFSTLLNSYNYGQSSGGYSCCGITTWSPDDNDWICQSTGNSYYLVKLFDINGNPILLQNWYPIPSFKFLVNIENNNAVFDFNFYANHQTIIWQSLTLYNTGIKIPIELKTSTTNPTTYMKDAYIYAYNGGTPCENVGPDGYGYWRYVCGLVQGLNENVIITHVANNITPPTGLEDIDPPTDTDCINDIIGAAQDDAEDEYNELVDDYITGYLANHESFCLNGLKEKFTYEYTSFEADYTLYYYDQSGELVQTIPPQDVKKGMLDATHFPNGIWDETEPVYLMPAKYSYNSAGVITEQVTPDAGHSQLFYNNIQQLRLSQNSKQAPLGKYTYFKYDNLNRIIETGEVTLGTSIPIATLEANIEDANYPSAMNCYEVKRTFYDDATITPSVFTAENLIGRVSSIAYYDFVPASGTADYNWATHYSYDMHGNVKSLLQDNVYLHHLPSQRYKRFDYTYDLISGKVNQLIYQDNEPDEFIHRYYYDADNRITNVFTSRDGFIWDQDAEYFYHKHGPLARVETGNDKVQGTDYAYTINGWIKGINSNTLMAKRDMGRDGHLRYSNLDKYIGQDAMSYNLGYYSGDYSPVGYITQDENAFASNFQNVYGEILPQQYSLYNGNVSSMLTNIYDIKPLHPFVPVPLLKTYRYDQLNRLRTMNSLRLTSAADYDDFILSNNWPDNSLFSSTYQENFNYDLNGNISELNRWYYYNVGYIDMLTYRYDKNSDQRLLNNRLLQIKDLQTNNPNITYGVENQEDPGNPTNWNYTYDNIGNLISDRSEQIQNISWTMDGKIKEVVRIPGSTKADLEFCYDPSGNRISKTVKPKDISGNLLPFNNWVYTYYIRDAQGNIAGIYDRNITIGGSTTTETLKITGQPIYGSARLGYDMNERVTETATYPWIPNITYDAHGNVSPGIQFESANQQLKNLQFNVLATFNRNMGQRMYELNDHLGNVLTTLSDIKTCEPIAPESQVIVTHFEGDGKEYFGDYTSTVDPVNSSNNIVIINPPTSGQFNFGPNFKIRVYPNDVITVSANMGSQTFSNNCGKLIAGITDGDGNWLADGNGNVQYYGEPSSLQSGWSWQTITTINQFQVPSTLPAVDLYLNVQTLVANGGTATGFDDLTITILPATAQKNYLSDITSVSDYYSGGMLMPERSYKSNSYKFGFNGQEKDDEWTGSTGSMLGFKFREYDSRIGRFFAVDPLADQRSWVSPYSYCQSNPISRIDPNGALDGWVEDKGTGEKTWDPNVNSQEEFNKSSYDPSKFSYAGQTLDIPGYGTIGEPKYTETKDRALGEKTPYGNVMGPEIELKFSPTDPNSQARWAQSISTNMGNMEQFDPNATLNPTEFVDPYNAENKDNPNFYNRYNSSTPSYQDYFRPLNWSFYDWPGRSQNPGGTVYFKAETSLLVNTDAGYIQKITLQWGFEMHGNGTSTTYPLKVINNPSPYHGLLLEGLKTVKP